MRPVAVNPDVDRAAWLEARRSGIGGSDIAGIIGVSPYTTPWQVYVDKIGLAPLDDEGTEAMRWGHVLERTILDEWEYQSGRFASWRGVMARHDDHDWMFATFDALETERFIEAGGESWSSVSQWISDTVIQPIEVKVSSDFGWPEGIPLHYQAQGQWQMMVSGHDSMIFVVLHNGRRLEVYDLFADPDDQAALLRAGRQFWKAYVETETPPVATAADNPAMADVWPQHVDDKVEIDADVVAELVTVRAEIKTLTERKDGLEARLKEALETAAVGTIEGEKAVSWKTQANNRPDTKRLKEEYPDVWREITPTDNTTRVFRVHIKETNE